MLEEILNKIDGNLERIANALEKEATKNEEVKPLENTAFVANIANNVTNQATPVQNQNSVVPVAPVAPVVQPMPVIPTEQIVPTETVIPTIPTTIVQESFTQEQLARAMSNAVSAGKKDTILNILERLGVQALTQINPTDYNKLAVMLKEAGVEV